MLSVDLRKRILEAYVQGRTMTYEKTVEVFEVGRAMVSRLLQRFRETGDIQPLPVGGNHPRKAELDWSFWLGITGTRFSRSNGPRPLENHDDDRCHCTRWFPQFHDDRLGNESRCFCGVCAATTRTKIEPLGRANASTNQEY